MTFESEAGWSGYPDARSVAMGDLWDDGGGFGGEYHQRSSPAGIAHVVNAPNGLWLRSSPDVGATNGITRMPNDSEVVWYEDAGNGWARIEFYGQEGYASKQYLEVGPYRAGQAPAPIPPYEPPAPPSPVIDLDVVPPTPPPPPVEAPKSKTAWYVVGAAAAVAAAYYLL